MIDVEETTSLLRAWTRGDEQAGDRLMERLYPDLRRLAASRLEEAGSDLTLQPTELVHEAYVRLVDQRRTQWQSRAHFFAIAARLVRRVLLNYARDRRRQKRGGGLTLLPLDEVRTAGAGETPPALDLLALDEALGRLAAIDPTAERVIELRYFGGLTVEETAEALGIGRATVVRSWRSGRIWLKELLGAGSPRP